MEQYWLTIEMVDNEVILTNCSKEASGEIIIPNEVTRIRECAFCGCNKVTSIIIPNSVTCIEESAFAECPELAYNDYDTACYLGNKENPYLVLVTTRSKDITSCEINANCKIIHDCAFQDCKELASITLPNDIESIGYSAFWGCQGLIYNEYGNACYLGNKENPYLVLVTTRSKEITSCEINANCKSIHDYAFKNCKELASITLPNGVTSIGLDAFEGCTGLTSIIVEPGHPFFDSRDNCNAFIFTADNELFLGCKNTVIPDSVTSIGDGAFYGCTGLTSIIIPDSVTSIGAYAFCGCSGLKSIIIPDSVTCIGEGAFYYCSELKNIEATGIGWSELDACAE